MDKENTYLVKKLHLLLLAPCEEPHLDEIVKACSPLKVHLGGDAVAALILPGDIEEVCRCLAPARL